MGAHVATDTQCASAIGFASAAFPGRTGGRVEARGTQMEPSGASERAGSARRDVSRQVARHRRLYDVDACGDVDARRREYASLIEDFYGLVTTFYRIGWGDSFHFAPRERGESLKASLARFEHDLADAIGLRAGMDVLDVGCGIAGPLCEIARHCGAAITGVNLSRHQVAIAEARIRRLGLAGRCRVVNADFMRTPLDGESFDAAYAFEATCHAPDRHAVFAEIHRLLKPGAVLGGTEWCMTARYDAGDPAHRRVKLGIEIGNAIPDLTSSGDVVAALAGAGFEILETRDAAIDPASPVPWYRPLEAGDLGIGSLASTPAGRAATNGITRALEWLRLAPRGTAAVSALLNEVAPLLVEGGRLGIFTPLFYFRARKPGGGNPAT